MSDARLIWGSTSLIPTPAEEAEYRAGTRSYLIEAVEGTDLGNPEAVVTAIRSHLQDGSLASVTSYDNRQGPLVLRVRAKTYAGLDAGGLALASEKQVPGFSTLSWTPSAALAVPTVYDVVYSDLKRNREGGWDLLETKVGNRELFRTYVATIESLPFGRDRALTMVQATSAGDGGSVSPTVTTIDNGSSATGWSGVLTSQSDGGSSDAGTVGSSGGVVYIAATVAKEGKRQANISLLRTGSGTTGTDVYVAVDWSCGNVPQSVTLSVSAGAPLDPVLTTAGAATGFTRSYFKVTAGTFSSLLFRAANITTDFDGSASLSIDQITSQNTLPAIGTNRQRSRSLTVGGSARARASLAITADAGKTLGDVTLLYTRTSTTGLQPSLRAYRSSSSAVTADATSVSGAYNALGTAMAFLLPANRFREAAHDLLLRLRATTAGTHTVTWTAALASVANADIPETTQTITGTTSVTFAAANTWQTSEVGLLQLPTVPVAADSTHVIRLTLVASNSVVQIDEGWLFDLDNGVLSWANTTGLTRLEVRTADLSNPEPSYWGSTVDGGAATAMVRADWRVVSFGTHTFEPGTMDVFTVTTGTEGSSCAAMYYRAWLDTAAA